MSKEHTKNNKDHSLVVAHNSGGGWSAWTKWLTVEHQWCSSSLVQVRQRERDTRKEDRGKERERGRKREKEK